MQKGFFDFLSDTSNGLFQCITFLAVKKDLFEVQRIFLSCVFTA